MNANTSLGNPYPLGATLYEGGVNFSIFSEHATGIELCLFDEDGEERERIRFKERYHHVWHIFVSGINAGQYYGYRVYGEHNPAYGFRFNPNKLLIDPYAKALSGILQWHSSLFGHNININDSAALSFNEQDSASYIPKSVVIDSSFDWEQDKAPKTPYHKTIIYEAHVKGFTKLHPSIPEEIRGTYSALAHPVTIHYLKDLGITAIELMPVHQFVEDGHLGERGLTNYWGYNTIGFFAPDFRYALCKEKGAHVNEFKYMVKELHKAGIEVILDVVYNHTAEGNQTGPTLSFRGIDNTSYYRLHPDDRSYYFDYTGTGNTLHADVPAVLRLIMDSLRYWILEMHVDGFRFDLAAALARELHDINYLSAFFDIIYQDPVISQVKLIAEPWDIGEGGYQVGKFPPGWAEWNGRYRDCLRDFWNGGGCHLGEFADRFTGSPDLYKNDYRLPSASINFITAHDGFTLHDLVSYNHKHNLPNNEENNDGENNNRSWNCGVEGPTFDSKVHALRMKQKRNLMATMLLSQGVPMIVAGDELGKTQNGNNNAYCQDNEISWIDWVGADTNFLQFTKKIIQLNKNHPVFSRRKWFQGREVKHSGLHDIAWFHPSGKEMEETDWNNGFSKSVTVYLNGKGIDTLDYSGNKITDDCFILMFNAYENDLPFIIPERNGGRPWLKVIDTTAACVNEEGCPICNDSDELILEGRSMVVLRRPLLL